MDCNIEGSFIFFMEFLFFSYSSRNVSKKKMSCEIISVALIMM